MNLTEDYVSFEVAKLLKEKGFDNYINWTQVFFRYFINDVTFSRWNWGEYNYSFKTGDSIHKSEQEFHYSEVEENTIIAPTHQMVIKWLREVHSIYITAEPDINDKHCFYPVIHTMTEESWDMQCFEKLEKLSFDKPEQAVEAALDYVLKNLI